MSLQFWQQKQLHELSSQEWEALCDGCGKCCLHKILEARDDVEDDEPMRSDDTLHYVNVTCQLLNAETGQCTQYAERLKHVPDCVVLSPENLERILFMPTSCAYRRVYEGRGLPSWHPLLHGGSRQAMEAAGMATTGYPLRNEADPSLTEDQLQIITWPLYDAP